MLRSLRLFLLVWSVLLTPQMALVHALSHTLANGAAQQAAGDDRQHASDKVCTSCLAFAQLDAALPTQFDFALPAHTVSALPASAEHAADIRALLAFRARAPPASLI
ncbi:MAG TPA: hypothetical protein VJ598_05995 [Albitalea sp.]|nr:hypothetical protein [Albitalea sp.]